MDDEAISIEGVDPGNCRVEDFLFTHRLQGAHGDREAFAIQPSAIARQCNLQSSHLVAIVEPDQSTKTQNVLATDDEFVVCPDTVLAQSTATVGEAFSAFGSSVSVETRGDAQAQEHALNLDQEPLVALRQAHADALALIALHAAIRIEESAKEADMEGGGRAMHGSRDRLASGPQTQAVRQMLERAELHSILAAAGYRVPAAKIGTVAQRSRRVVSGLHDGVHPRTLITAICRQGTRPCR